MFVYVPPPDSLSLGQQNGRVEWVGECTVGEERREISPPLNLRYVLIYIGESTWSSGCFWDVCALEWGNSA